MKQIIKTIINGKIEEYEVLLKFISNITNKKYIFYTDKLCRKIFISYYSEENGLYTLTPILNKDEYDMCLNILNGINC